MTCEKAIEFFIKHYHAALHVLIWAKYDHFVDESKIASLPNCLHNTMDDVLEEVDDAHNDICTRRDWKSATSPSHSTPSTGTYISPAFASSTVATVEGANAPEAVATTPAPLLRSPSLSPTSIYTHTTPVSNPSLAPSHVTTVAHPLVATAEAANAAEAGATTTTQTIQAHSPTTKSIVPFTPSPTMYHTHPPSNHSTSSSSTQPHINPSSASQLLDRAILEMQSHPNSKNLTFTSGTSVN